eukprot:14788886-Heterocapsa_arctica.AAC.1
MDGFAVGYDIAEVGSCWRIKLNTTRRIFNETAIIDQTEGSGFHTTTFKGCKGILREGALRPQLWSDKDCRDAGFN